jgi:hypothetical protein
VYICMQMEKWYIPVETTPGIREVEEKEEWR